MAEPTPTPAPAPATTPQGESKKDLLADLLSGKDGWMKIGVILIVLSGGGNILATKQGVEVNSAEIQQGLKEIHDLHEQLSASMERQKEILAAVKPSPSSSPK